MHLNLLVYFHKHTYQTPLKWLQNHCLTEQFGHERQIFFIDYGGWDHHDELLQNQMDMLTEVDDAIGEFHTALSSINKLDSVTTFTVSEFCRTLTSKW